MAYTLNGTNQDMQTSSVPIQKRPLSSSVWFYTGSTALMTMVVPERVNASDGQNGYLIRVNGQKINITTFAGVASSLNGSTNYTLNSWQHGCAVWDTTYRKVYLNGVEDAGDGDSTDVTQNRSLTQISVGSRYNLGRGQYFNGRIAEVGIWSAALNASEVASLARGISCKKVRPQNLVFYSPLVRELVDVRGGLAITNNNSATVTQHPRMYA